MNYVWHVLVLANIYALAGWSLNLVAGYTGLLSLCHAAFCGIGAYSTTLLMMKGGLDFVPALLISIPLTGVISLVVAVPTLRLKGDYFVLATLGFQVIVFTILNNWVNVTRGPSGIPGIPRPAIFGVPLDTPLRYLLFCSAIAAVCGLLLWGLTESAFGRVLKAVREDDTAAAALGKNVTKFRVSAFAIAAAFAAIPGALFAGHMQFIDPTSFTVTESVFILSVVIIGGAGSFWGPFFGALLLTVLPETLRFLQLSDAVAANVRQIIYGGLLIVVIRYRPQGICGRYRFE